MKEFNTNNQANELQGVNIEGLNKRKVMRALYNHAVNTIAAEVQAGESNDPVDRMFASGAVELSDEVFEDLDISQGSKEINSDARLINVRDILGVPIEMNLSASIVSGSGYDNNYGKSAAQEVIEALRNEVNETNIEQ